MSLWPWVIGVIGYYSLVVLLCRRHDQRQRDRLHADIAATVQKAMHDFYFNRKLRDMFGNKAQDWTCVTRKEFVVPEEKNQEHSVKA